MKHIVIIALVMFSALATIAPAASAGGPVCVQVYPWSELCEPETPPGGVCLQVYPWSELCEGNPRPVACHYVEGLPSKFCDTKQ